MDKKVVILTKSSKFKNHCVAGIDIDTGDWVRFVSLDEARHGALTTNNIKYADGTICTPLDVVNVEIEQYSPSNYQPENYLIDTSYYWQKCGEYSLSDVTHIHPGEVRPFLYGNVNQYVNEAEIRNIGYSLTLIEVSSLTVNQTTNMYDKPKTKASFLYNHRWYYKMSVTDPAFYSVPDGTTYAHAYLVVSLPGQPFPDDCYYKFVAQIYPI